MSDNWLTPETAIGCRLPCGAVVEKAEWTESAKESVTVFFDRVPAVDKCNSLPEKRVFKRDGCHWFGKLPNLIPPTPAQPRVFVTREAWQSAIKNLDAEWTFRDLERALGIPPGPPKVEPWQEAYEAWSVPAFKDGRAGHKQVWQAAVEWCVEQIEAVEARTWNSAKLEALLELRRRIMGDQA